MTENFNVFNFEEKIYQHTLLKQSINLQTMFFFKLLFPRFISKLLLNGGNVYIYVKKKFLIQLMFFLNNHSYMNYKTLVDIAVVDKLQMQKRFIIYYNLLSIMYTARAFVIVETDESTSIPSLTNIFESSDWAEREAWDMFGIRFANHPDLRRILTDYGFDGHPLKKDFPLTGYNEILYSDASKSIVYRNVSLAQEYRVFKYTKPWFTN